MSSAVDDYTFLRNEHYSVQPDYVTETQWLYQNDTNGGVYDGGKLTFDLSKLANNGMMNYQDWSRSHLVIPLVATLNADAVGVDRNDFAVTLKNSHVHLVNSATILVNNKPITNPVNYRNLPIYFTQLNSAGVNDLNARSYLGLSNLDTSGAWSYNNVGTSTNTGVLKTFNGNGLINNLALPPSQASNLNLFTQTTQSNFSVGDIYNKGMYDRISSIRTIGLNNTLLNETIIRNDAKDYTFSKCLTANTGDATGTGPTDTYQVWYWTAMIKLSDLAGGFFDKLGLVKGPLYVTITLDMNCVGSMILPYIDGNATAGRMSAYFAGNTSLNWTCPLLVNPYGLSRPTPATVRNFCLSVGIVKPPVLLGSYAGTAHNSLGITHPISNARVYVPSVKLTLEAEKSLMVKGDSKRILFNDYFQNSTSISANGSLDTLVASNMKGAYALLVCAYPSKTVNGVTTGTPANTVGFSCQLSPFAPIFSPCVLSQVQVNIGGKVLFANGNINYGWENYVEQVKGFLSLNGNEEMGLSSSIVSKSDWENQRYYLFTFNIDDINSSNSINFSCVNNSAIALDLQFFVFVKKQCVMNIQNGQMESSNF